MTRTLQTILEEKEEETTPDLHTSLVTKPKKMQDVYIKIYNVSETMHTEIPSNIKQQKSVHHGVS